MDVFQLPVSLSASARGTLEADDESQASVNLLIVLITLCAQLKEVWLEVRMVLLMPPQSTHAAAHNRNCLVLCDGGAVCDSSGIIFSPQE